MAKQLTGSEAARLLGALGASKGGQARAKALTKARRRAIARKAATTRWRKAKGRKAA